MWFRVKGVPAVVTIGRDGLWSEIAELAAVAGAQVHIHLAAEATERAPAPGLVQPRVLRHVHRHGQLRRAAAPSGTTCEPWKNAGRK